MKTHTDQVDYLMGSIDQLSDPTYAKRNVLLTLLYWKVFDGIDIPPDLMQAILKKGSNPETIFRLSRRPATAGLMKRELEHGLSIVSANHDNE